MGRYIRPTTSEYLRLDVRGLLRNRLLIPGAAGAISWSRGTEQFASVWVHCPDTSCVTLAYTRQDGSGWKQEKYSIRLEWTPCNYGGKRPWFRCLGVGCGRRVAVLYGGGIFACRTCHGLTYDSQREAKYLRALHRAQAIRIKLGGSANLYELFPPKPKGMHRQTYLRLRAEERQANQQSCPPWLTKKSAEPIR
jgi:hypothetical protein